MNRIICLFKGHKRISWRRRKFLNYAISMYACDAWGSDAFSNVDRMNELRKQKKSCVRCGASL